MLNPYTPESDVSRILNATNSLFDSMGVFQHHDAITGTEAHFVAADYSVHLERAIS